MKNVWTKGDAATLAEILCCSQYTANAGTAEQKEKMLKAWLLSPHQPYDLATCALCGGFDYAHVRFAIHVNEPSSLVDFAQESGRAGRDGKQAYSVLLLSCTWKPQATEEAGIDAKALNRYMLSQDCRRACLSEHIDTS
jgi:superfamily II DNA helicase RecQ